MTRKDAGLIAGPSGGLISWLAWGAIGPAAVFIPVNWATDKLAGAAARWFKRFRQTDDLSRLVKAAAGPSAQLNRGEIKKLGKLLEDEETWRQLSGSEVTRLTDRIAACLSSGAREAADAIARGLLEFAVFDLEPNVFQKVVQARLQQMTDQASALDEALFRMHEDLYHLVNDVKDLFRLVSDRLPPGRANLREIKIYLEGLIDWLNIDPWPRDDPRLGGPALTPAVIERKLRVSGTGPAHEHDADADELARQCSRLVILGGPGSGKTWLAMRTARICAEEALQGLEDDAALDKVELPLYTTCSRLISTPGDIREAAVSGALNSMGDLGGSRIVKALCLFFTERIGEPTVLVIDSLDEASDVNIARDRLRQAGSLKPPWRVVLTSRRSSWNNQLTIEDANPAHRVGELQPLRYPDDVVPVIQRWFANQPGHRQALAAEIAWRPSLQQAATVPLILAFYCILAGGRIPLGDRPLPTFRHKLYEQVISRMLHGLWRPGSGPLRDADVCRETLRAWAWPRVKEDHAVSGVGQWKDDVPTRDAQLSPAGQTAVDHIAVPLGGADFDTGETLRRFVHRSIREQLVAEHVAELPSEEAVKALLPHLWYDPDWEYTVPAALAMHTGHDEVLRGLLCRAARSDENPGDLSVIDAGGEALKLLARVAAESAEHDWSPELKEVISEARVQLARSGIVSDLGEAAYWPASNRHVRAALLERLADDPNDWEVPRLVATLLQLDPEPEDKRQALNVLLSQLIGSADISVAAWLVDALVQLDPEPGDKRQAREALLALRPAEPSDADGWEAVRLAVALAQLDPAPDDKRKVRDFFLGFLADPDNWVDDEAVMRGLVQLAQTPEDMRETREAVLELLTSDTASWSAKRLAATIIELDPDPDDRGKVRDVLLALLTGRATGADVTGLANIVVRLAQTPEDKRRTLNVVLDLLAGRAAGTEAAKLAALVVQLDPEPGDKRQALDAVLARLDQTPDDTEATKLAALVVQLDPEPGDKRRARGALLTLLDRQIAAAVAAGLAADILQLDPDPEDKSKVRGALLTLLTNHATGAESEGQAALWLFADHAGGSLGAELVALVVQADPSPGGKRQALDAALRLLTEETTGTVAAGLAGMVAQLDPTRDDEHKARGALIALLDNPDQGLYADRLAACVAQLNPEPEEKRRARNALLRLFTGQITGAVGEAVAAGLNRLDTPPEEKRQARRALLDQLSGRPVGTVAELISVTLELAATPEDKREVLDALLSLLLARKTDSAVAAELINGAAQLDPTVQDLSNWRAWAAPPTFDLLTAVRRNSALNEWLAVLPSLSPLSS